MSLNPIGSPEQKIWPRRATVFKVTERRVQFPHEINNNREQVLYNTLPTDLLKEAFLNSPDLEDHTTKGGTLRFLQKQNKEDLSDSDEEGEVLGKNICVTNLRKLSAACRQMNSYLSSVKQHDNNLERLRRAFKERTQQLSTKSLAMDGEVQEGSMKGTKYGVLKTKVDGRWRSNMNKQRHKSLTYERGEQEEKIIDDETIVKIVENSREQRLSRKVSTKQRKLADKIKTIGMFRSLLTRGRRKGNSLLETLPNSSMVNTRTFDNSIRIEDKASILESELNMDKSMNESINTSIRRQVKKAVSNMGNYQEQDMSASKKVISQRDRSHRQTTRLPALGVRRTSKQGDQS